LQIIVVIINKERLYLRYDLSSFITNTREDLREIFEYFIDFLKAIPGPRGRISDATIYRDVIVIRQYFHDNEYQLQDFTVDNIIKFLINKNKRNAELRRFKRFSRFLDKNNILNKEIHSDIQNIKMKNKAKPTFVEPEDETKFAVLKDRWPELYQQIDKANNSIRMGLFIGLEFGLREGELVHLRISNLVLSSKEKYLKIEADPDRQWFPKTLNSERRIPITERQSKIISNYLKKRERLFNEYFKKRKHDYVLYNWKDGKPMAETTLWYWFKKIKVTSIEKGREITRHCTPKTTRYSFAVYLYRTTNDIYTVSKMLGHGSISITEVYLAFTEQQRFDLMKTAQEKAGF
jgi:site-specific recombinase XerD